MSSWHFTYFGPFFEIPGVMRNVDTLIKECTPGCVGATLSPGPYCQLCGKKVSARASTQLTRVRLHPRFLPSQFEDSLSRVEPVGFDDSQDASVWISNNTSLGHWFSANRETPFVSVSPRSVLEMETRFVEKHAELKAYIEEEFGVTPQLRTGVISYYS